MGMIEEEKFSMAGNLMKQQLLNMLILISWLNWNNSKKRKISSDYISCNSTNDYTIHNYLYQIFENFILVAHITKLIFFPQTLINLFNIISQFWFHYDGSKIRLFFYFFKKSKNTLNSCNLFVLLISLGSVLYLVIFVYSIISDMRCRDLEIYYRLYSLLAQTCRPVVIKSSQEWQQLL